MIYSIKRAICEGCEEHQDFLVKGNHTYWEQPFGVPHMPRGWRMVRTTHGGRFICPACEPQEGERVIHTGTSPLA